MAEKVLNYDFGGYATKNNLRCSDGRIIQKDAFKHNDGRRVPLLWKHLQDDPSSVLGHAILENREDGVYAYCKFNNTPAGKNVKELVRHGDIVALSIYANELKQKGSAVVHGEIKEVSLVVSGANPGAYIDNLQIAHADDDMTDFIVVEAIFYTGLGLEFPKEEIKHSEDSVVIVTEPETLPVQTEGSIIMDTLTHANKYPDDATVQDVFDTLDETQKTVVYALIAQAISTSSAEHSDTDTGGDLDMKTNVFDQSTAPVGATLTHDQMNTIMETAKKIGSLKEAVLYHADEYGIENIETLFPDPRLLRPTPDLIKRDDDWVSIFIEEANKTPFSRIKSQAATLTADEARAKGYITGNRKIEEVFPVLKRVTTPTMIYKKQKLDREDVIDITDFDVVAWLKIEMRALLNEEIARACLIGDGRPLDDPDSINPLNIRPIWTDDELYSHKMLLENEVTILDFIDEVIRARKFYKGTGIPTLYTTEELLTEMLLARDLNQRHIYNSVAELTSALRVKKIVTVEPMDGQTRDISGTPNKHQVMGILVNMRDYTIGADKGGQLAMFDNFDIDYNQYKYLIETRISGALTRPKSAVVLERFIGPGQG